MSAAPLVRPTTETVDNITAPLPRDTLSRIGLDKRSEPQLGPSVHADVAAGWDTILRQGLDAEIRRTLVDKYPAIANCPGAGAPKINLQVRGAVTEASLRRDERLVQKQVQVSACLTAIGSILSIALVRPDQEENRQLQELAGDAGRLLSDLYFSESETRKILLGTGLNSKFKNAIGEAPTDEWLFGIDLEERLKTVKSLERSTLELKPEKAYKPSTQQALNSKRPSTFKPPARRLPRVNGQTNWQPRNTTTNQQRTYNAQQTSRPKYQPRQPRSDNKRHHNPSNRR